LKLRTALVNAIDAKESIQLNNTLLIRINGAIPLKSQTLAMKDRQIKDSPLRITLLPSPASELVSEVDTVARVHVAQVPVVPNAHICFKVGFKQEDGEAEEQLLLRPIISSSEFIKPGPKELQFEPSICVYFNAKIRVVGIEITPVLHETENGLGGAGNYSGTVVSAGLNPKCVVFDNPSDCIELSKEWGLQCGWTSIVTSIKEGNDGRCHDSFTVGQVEKWCDQFCEHIDVHSTVETFEGMYQCLREPDDKCSVKKMIRNTHGIHQAIGISECDMDSSSDPRGPFNQRICMESVLNKLDWDRCGNTFILPDNTLRRPCIQPETITVGEGPRTEHVHGVKTASDCNYQCALGEHCTNWVFDLKNESCTLKSNRYNPTLKDVVAAMRIPKAGFTSGLLCHDPAKNLDMKQFLAHRNCLGSCERSADWGKCYDNSGNTLPGRPSEICSSLDNACYGCKIDMMDKIAKSKPPIAENLTVVRFERECAAECSQAPAWGDCFDFLGNPIPSTMGACDDIGMRCFICMKKLRELELPGEDQTIETPFKTSEKLVSRFHVGDMYVGVDSKNPWGVDETVEGFDVSSSISVSTFEECRFKCQLYRRCEVFVFSASEQSCALKTGAPSEAVKPKLGSIIGSKYDGITCGSRIHTHMQIDRQRLSGTLSEIRNRFPVCSEVCKTYEEISAEIIKPQALQMMSKTRVYPEAPGSIFDRDHFRWVYAVFTMNRGAHEWPVFGKKYLQIWYTDTFEKPRELLLSSVRPGRFRSWRWGDLVGLEYSRGFRSMMEQRYPNENLRDLFWLYDTEFVTDCNRRVIWRINQKRELSSGSTGPWLQKVGLNFGHVHLSSFRFFGLNGFFNGIVLRGDEVCAVGGERFLLQAEPVTKCQVCCVHSPLLGVAHPPKVQSCSMCREEGTSDEIPGFPLLLDPSSVACKTEPKPVPVPKPSKKPRCVRLPRRLSFLNRIFKKESPLCREGNLRRILQIINSVSLTAAAGCFGATLLMDGICTASSLGVGFLACQVGAAGMIEACVAIRTASQVVAIADLGRAAGCKAFAGECLPF